MCINTWKALWIHKKTFKHLSWIVLNPKNTKKSERAKISEILSIGSFFLVLHTTLSNLWQSCYLMTSHKIWVIITKLCEIYSNEIRDVRNLFPSNIRPDFPKFLAFLEHSFSIRASKLWLLASNHFLLTLLIGHSANCSKKKKIFFPVLNSFEVTFGAILRHQLQ